MKKITLNGIELELPDALGSKIQKACEEWASENGASYVKKSKIRPDEGEEYYYIDMNGVIESFDYNEVSNFCLHKRTWESGNGFFTKEEAEKELQIRQAKQRLIDYKRENLQVIDSGSIYERYYVGYRSYYFNRSDYFTCPEGPRKYFGISKMAEQVDSFKVLENWRYVETEEQAEQWAKDCEEDWRIYLEVE